MRDTNHCFASSFLCFLLNKAENSSDFLKPQISQWYCRTMKDNFFETGSNIYFPHAEKNASQRRSSSTKIKTLPISHLFETIKHFFV